MDSTKSDIGVGPGLSGRVIPRRSIRDPIVVSDSPIYGSQTSNLFPTSSFNGSHPRSPSSPGPKVSLRSPSPSLIFNGDSIANKDFSVLRNPGIYHTLSNFDIPPPLRHHVTQPGSSISVTELISEGHFRDAAVTAAQILTAPGLDLTIEEIFNLMYQRLACLTLCNQTALAAQESKALEDLNSACYRDGKTGKHLVPWELRLLAVRLQGIGFGDVRRGVMGYYDLVSESRITLITLKKQRRLYDSSHEEIESLESEISVWEKRLSELGIRVASALIEMEDFDEASRFLSTLQSSSFNSDIDSQKALLWLCLGNIEAARSCTQDKVIIVLAYMADGQFEKAVLGWQDLISTGNSEDVAMWKQNLAVSLIYLGRINEAREILEKLVDQEYGFHALTFNLSTIYELCTDQSRSLKIELVEKLANIARKSKVQGSDKSKIGWDKVNADFKL